MDRLKNKIAIVVGAGQTPGMTIGNGRATALTFGREGAAVLCVDRDIASAEETAAMIKEKGGEAFACRADVTVEADLANMVQDAVKRWGRLDILHNNVGVGFSSGDAPTIDVTEAAFDLVYKINLRGTVFACKYALRVMRPQMSGVITNISSAGAFGNYPNAAYKATKAALIPFTQQLAIQNAEYGIRANVILPGPIDTPMGVDTRVRMTGTDRGDLVKMLDAMVPLRGKQGTGWDIANAALFLASDEANFITGVQLPVDGGRLMRNP